MGEPFGKTPINGVLSCWFDDQPEEQTQPAVASAPAVTVAQRPVEPTSPSPALSGQHASNSLLDLMEAINDRHMLPDLFVPAGGKQTEPLMRPEDEPKPVRAQQYRPSFQDLVSQIYHSAESRSYQWLTQQGLAMEFDQRAISLEQRWNTDGSYCAVRRTANGYTHTVMLKADGTICGERIAGPNGPMAQFTATGFIPAEENRFASRAAARQSA